MDTMVETYQYLLLYDIFAGEIISSMERLEGGTLGLDQVNARLQFIQHNTGISLSVIEMSELLPPDELFQTGDQLNQACRRWWNGTSDPQTLKQEAIAIQESLQPRLETLGSDLLNLGQIKANTEKSFRNSISSMVEDVGTLEVESTADIFQAQRGYRPVLWAVAPVLGTMGAGANYTSPQESFQCKFDLTGNDGELLYDFVFPERTVAVFTNDFGEGQAVEWRPLEAAPADANAAKALVDALFQKTMLPVLTQQHSGLSILEQKWVELPGDPPLPALQVVLGLPEASFIVELIGDGEEKHLDVVRGLWIFIKGDQAYTIIFQPNIHYETKGGMTDPERIQVVVDGLAALQQNCEFK
jgi:hypothetical protein